MRTSVQSNIPRASDLSITDAIKVATPDGVVELFPFHLLRGVGKRKYCLSLYAFTDTAVAPTQTCYCWFRGVKYHGHFSFVSPKHRGRYTVQFETVIEDEAFWKGMP